MKPLSRERAWTETRHIGFSSEKPNNGLSLYIAAGPWRIGHLPTDHLEGRWPR